MTAKEIVEQMQDLMNRFPECANREVKIFGPHGRSEIDEVALSSTSNIWYIQK